MHTDFVNRMTYRKEYSSEGSDYSSDTYEFDVDVDSEGSAGNPMLISIEKKHSRSPVHKTLQNDVAKK